jgi:predicted nucleic acid-binding Zn ribbon protein
MGMNDPPPVKCPMEEVHYAEVEYTLEKLISRSNFQLKGSGWYSTDYKKKESSK